MTVSGRPTSQRAAARLARVLSLTGWYDLSLAGFSLLLAGALLGPRRRGASVAERHAEVGDDVLHLLALEVIPGTAGGGTHRSSSSNITSGSTRIVYPGEGAGEPGAWHLRARVGPGPERSGLRGIVGVEVGVRVGAAGPEGDLGRGAGGGDRGWLGGEAEVGEDGVDDGGVGDGGQDPHGAGAAGAHQKVLTEDPAV